MKDQNATDARALRQGFEAIGCYVVELMGSPGCGKTALLQASIPRLGPCGVINGDMSSDRDVRRLADAARWAVQVETGDRCHLNADDVSSVDLGALAPVDIVFVENVGNLVCPAAFPVGAHARVLLISTPEGDDKLSKYPVAVAAADLLVISKSDLLPFVSFRVERALADARRIKPDIPAMVLSARRMDGMSQWLDWLRALRAETGAGRVR